MPSYTAPVRDMQYLLHEVLEVGNQTVPGYDEIEADFTAAVIEEAGKIGSDVLAPLNATPRAARWRTASFALRTASGPPSTRCVTAAGPGWTCRRITADRPCPMSSASR